MADPPTFPVSALTFAHYARRLGAALAARSLVVPAFRSPPKTPGITRSIWRKGPVVCVSIVGREIDEVVRDMIEGSLMLNDRSGLYYELWSEVMAPDPGRTTPSVMALHSRAPSEAPW